MSTSPAKALTLATHPKASDTTLALPELLRSTTRSGANEIDPLLEGVEVSKVITLHDPSRSAGAGAPQPVEGKTLLALEASDGTTLFIRADALGDAIARRKPEAITTDGVVDFSQFRDPNISDRGAGEMLWQTARLLKLPVDEMLDKAKAQALAWAKKELGDAATDLAVDVTSFLGAKALMWVIESHLAGDQGLYRWTKDTLEPADYRPAGHADLVNAAANNLPMLILIHGTASNTLGSFGDLRSDSATWDKLVDSYPGGIYGFEHRTFSASPTENALLLLDILPANAKISLLTQSRGGLVGDLLCLGSEDEDTIDAYQIGTNDAADATGLGAEAERERQRLRDIRTKLKERGTNFVIDRYVRIACPARGTRFLSENLDAALSDFLNLLQWGGGRFIAATASALGGPVAGAAWGAGASSVLGVVKRLVLEIAGRRIDPRLVPGLAAMRIDSPLATFLARAETLWQPKVKLAVIAGDTEFDGLGLSHIRRRLVNLFCDRRLFERNDNDFVIDTDSMYAGLGFKTSASYLFHQDDSVTHFNYYKNALTCEALRDWLTVADTGKLTAFTPLDGGSDAAKKASRTARGSDDAPNDSRPIVILLPGIMGTHLKIERPTPSEAARRNRIWFDIPSLILGEFSELSNIVSPAIQPDEIFALFYGELADRLALTHKVVCFPYDWRQPIDAAATLLNQQIVGLREQHPNQPIRLLAHSMGGLVVRALMAMYPQTWKQVVNTDGRLLMLGTPNNGSHSMVHALLGKTTAVRGVASIDRKNTLQAVVNIIAQFPGALSLMPRPDFVDSSGTNSLPAKHYYLTGTWQPLAEANRDIWFGNKIGATPNAQHLDTALAFWSTTLPNNTVLNPDRVAYVFGRAYKTPCGVAQRPGKALELLYTHEGDGSVTWKSGRLDNLAADERCWFMPVEHADLASTEAYFDAIVDLLIKGHTDKLQRLPKQRGAESASFALEAEPPTVPSQEELARALLGSGPRRRVTKSTRTELRVSVMAGHLSFVDQPVICGHYAGDAISGAEAALDQKLKGGLAERQRLGIYAAEIGTQAIVLRPPNEAEKRRGSLNGAVIVGLGNPNGQLSPRQVTETVCAGVKRFLLLRRDVIPAQPSSAVKLYSLLIGCDSNPTISIAESVAAVTRGVLRANREVRDARGKDAPPPMLVTDLCFVELYRDAAISAAHVVVDLSDHLKADLQSLGAHIKAERQMLYGDGVQERLDASAHFGHWSRLIVTDADAPDVECAPECYELRCKPPVPVDVLRRLLAQIENCEPSQHARDSMPSTTTTDGQAMPVKAAADQPMAAPLTPYLPNRLKYVFLSQRARAETIVQNNQPGMLENNIRAQRRNTAFNAELSRTLFQLLVPHDFKMLAREQARLILVLDGQTANLPWELMQVDGQPLVVTMPLVRQLSTQKFRATERSVTSNTACIIISPSTHGFDKRFGGKSKSLDELAGAIREGQAIRNSLVNDGWLDRNVVVSQPGRDAMDVINTLHQQPYRVLVICAHGVFQAKARDSKIYTGVVLSDGMLISAVEISAMEIVPEVVFLNCCHLGSISNGHSQPNRLAYSLARELIENGVRCVVAAGWAVNDAAAATFAGTFFDNMVQGETFGDAIFQARKVTHDQHRDNNTWGAYQAYGDPGYRLHPKKGDGGEGNPRGFVAVEELLATLQRRRVHHHNEKLETQQRWVAAQLNKGPKAWADRADVQQAIAQLYGELGAAGFEAARTHYLRAIQLEDKLDRVSVRSIEQLANIEARHGYELVEGGKRKAGVALVDVAIARLDALTRSTRGKDADEANAERAAIIGSTYKIKGNIILDVPILFT